MAVVGAEPTVGTPQKTKGCRARLRQVLATLDASPVNRERVLSMVEATQCAAHSDLAWADLTRYISVEEDLLRLTRDGRNWLLEHGAPSPDWKSYAADNPPLRAWQVEALESWCAHGRHGVIEAVTGTGKSRVGIEAAREALADGFSVLVVVPGIDLAHQWIRSLRQFGLSEVGQRGGGESASFATDKIVVATVQSLWANPPTPAEGRGLIIADECHRYGSEQWRNVLHPAYRRRIGLTATFERTDDGMETLERYFGGQPVYNIGFDRAIGDGVVAAYDVALIPTDLTPRERWEYRRAEDTLRDSRMRLIAADFPSEPFGRFLREVQKAAEDFADPTIEDTARRYLKAFSERIDIVTTASAKLTAIPALAPLIARSHGSILFTRRTDAAEDIAASLSGEGITAVAVHSDMSRAERNANLDGLKSGRIKAVAAPMVLDEGIDVPDVDLAAVLAGSRSRRQMIQRMGRVLRLKRDGRKAKFLVFYARDTIEDPNVVSDPLEGGALGVILSSADSVQECTSDDLRGDLLSWSDGLTAATSATRDQSTTHGDGPANAPEPEADAGPPMDALDSIDVARSAVRSYCNYHGGSPLDAELALVRLLVKAAEDPSSHRTRGNTEIYWGDGVQLTVKNGQIVQYFHERTAEALVMSRVKQDDESTPPPSGSDRGSRSRRRGEHKPTVADQLSSIDPATLPITQSVIDIYRGLHGGDADAAENGLREMLTDFMASSRKRVGRRGHVQLARAGFILTVAPERFVFYRKTKKDRRSWREVKRAMKLEDSTTQTELPNEQAPVAIAQSVATSPQPPEPPDPPALAERRNTETTVRLVQSLSKLADLHERNLLSTEEFATLKASLIRDFGRDG